MVPIERGVRNVVRLTCWQIPKCFLNFKTGTLLDGTAPTDHNWIRWLGPPERPKRDKLKVQDVLFLVELMVVYAIGSRTQVCVELCRAV